MERYTANYSHTNPNFVIQNIKGKKQINDKYYPVICVLKNILQRGCPTIMSQFLQSKLGAIHLDKRFTGRHILIDNVLPQWFNTIKGDDDNNNFPAKTFYEEIIPEFFADYPCLQQIILPEASINEITQVDNDNFINNQVDFYVPQAKLVIEIDGNHHQKDKAISAKDDERVKYLKKYGITTIRIRTYDLNNRNQTFLQGINNIKQRLDEFAPVFNTYSKIMSIPFDKLVEDNYLKQIMRATAIIRFQILLLSLLEKGILNFEQKVWDINVIQRDITDFAGIAIEDLFLWLENLCKLNKLLFKRPKINLEYCSSEDPRIKDGFINIDFSLLKKWTDENEIKPNVIFVRTDYYGNNNYFRVSTSDPIKYKIINDGKDTDVPALQFLLKNIFGFEEFRDGQLSIIINSLSCQDTIGLLPTGSGKSLCYQFVALLQPCVSFIVCPIKSLMYDQKDNQDNILITNNNYISSDQKPQEKDLVARNFSQGKYQYIWISPERFQTKDFRKYLTFLNLEQVISYAIIDEVHCLSEWGHDFRTSYLNLIKTIRKYCPSSILLGLTATASSSVLEDLKREFEIDNENIKTLPSFTRPELKFEVVKEPGKNRGDKEKVLINLLSKMNKQRDLFNIDEGNTKSGIIFTLFKSGDLGCYELSSKISSLFKIKSKWYSGEPPKKATIHGQQFNKYKQETQEGFKKNEFPLLIATKAFGMGIDKPNIRYTIHYGIPNSLEALYQEAGRAGRDRMKANCYVLYSQELIDNETMNKLFDINTTIEEINQISDEVKYEGRDVLGNFFLWLINNKGVKSEFKLIKKILNAYAEPNKKKTIKSNEFENSGLVEKCIYRLSLLGIIEDWIILSWGDNRIIEAEFSDYNINTIQQSLISFIRNYDKEFSLTEDIGQSSKYTKYAEILKDDNIKEIDKYIKILLEWIYDTIVYTRRQSIKNIMEQCNNFKSSEEFKRVIDSYFKFNDNTFLLDHIAQKPKEYSYWFDLFYSKDQGEKHLVSNSDIFDLKNSISRYLESYRFNTGLNFISGLIRLILDDFENQDGKPRFESAFNQIIADESITDESKKDILLRTLEFRPILDEKNKYYLSKVLCEYYREDIINIYEELQDYHSLQLILNSNKERLEKTIGRLL